jgi:hypothetical protein
MMPWDWEWDAARSAAFVIERLQRGSIVCMHDGQAAAPRRMPERGRPNVP